MTFPLEQDGRFVPAVPGSRKWAVALDDVLARVRTLVASVDRRVFMPLQAEPDDDPILAPMLSACGPRLHVPGELAILPPSLRFNRGDRRVFAAKMWMNGVSGYVLAPSDFRRGLAIWGFSESGLLRHEEYATPAEWLAECVAGLENVAPSRDPDELWRLIEANLPNPEPPPNREPPIRDGTWTSSRHGVTNREEEYRNGVRHGRLRWWDVVEDFPPNADVRDVVAGNCSLSCWQGALIREGTFVEGAAHGEFRFYTDEGKLTHEVEFQRGFPAGACTVHPEATRGLCEPATIRYEHGLPTSWSIPPYAYASAMIDCDGVSGTIADIAGGGPAVLVDCTEASEHELAEDYEHQLDGIAVIGVGAQPGRGKLGNRSIEIVADPARRLTRAYGYRNEKLMPFTFVQANGESAGGSQRVLHLLPRIRERLHGRQSRR